jgi:hypothetical protein
MFLLSLSVCVSVSVSVYCVQSTYQLVFQSGLKPIHLACQRSSADTYAVVSKLLELKANANARDFEGNTPLHYACTRNDPELVQILIKNNARVYSQNNVCRICAIVVCLQSQSLTMAMQSTLRTPIHELLLQPDLSQSLVTTLIERYPSVIHLRDKVLQSVRVRVSTLYGTFTTHLLMVIVCCCAVDIVLSQVGSTIAALHLPNQLSSTGQVSSTSKSTLWSRLCMST